MVRTPKRFGWWITAAGILGPLSLLACRGSGDGETAYAGETPAAAAETRAPPADDDVDPLLESADRHLEGSAFAEAITAFEEAVTVAERKGRRDILAGALSGLGVAYKRRGDYHLAVTTYLRALEVCRALDDRFCEAEPLHNLGTCYIELGELEAARNALNEALAAWPTPYGQSITTTALATVDDLEDDPEAAIATMRRAMAQRLMAPEVAPDHRRRGRATTLDRLAGAYKKAGRMEDARRAYESSLRIFEDLGPKSSLAVVSDNFGWFLVDQHRPEEALGHFERALALLEDLDRPHDRAHTLFGQARAYRQLDDPAAANAAVERAIEIIESLRSTARSQRLKASFLAIRQPYYELYVDLLMERHRAEPDSGFDARALWAAERFKARSLLDLLHQQRSALRERSEGELLELEERLHRQINAKDRERIELEQSAAPLEKFARVEKEQLELILRYENLAPRFRTGAAAVTAPPIDPGRMRDLLDDRTLLLVYFLGDERSFLWAVRRGGLRSFELPARAQLEDLARQTYDWLRQSDQRGDPRDGRDAAGRLREILLDPLGKALHGQRLVVVPDGWLHYVPFGALPGADGRPLVLDREIVTLPSVSVLAALRERAAGRAPPAKLLAVVADPVFSLDDPRHATAGTRGGLAPPERLTYAKAEAEAILALAPPGERFAALGFDADRETVLDGELDRYRIVHFAVHGEVNDEQPEISHLVLSLVDRQGRPRDGRLYLHEIDDLRLPADLVVLSACNTALGKNVRGEGVVGMTRAFMYAGASSVLVSLWFVSDEGTAELMGRFYRELLVEGRPPAAALRAAQLWMQRSPRWRAPYYWAGFVLQGEWRERQAAGLNR